MNNKSKFLAGLVYGIIIVLFTLLFLIIPFTKTATSWLSFGITIFSVIVGFLVFLVTFDNKSIKNTVYGFPIYKVSVIYNIIELVLCLIFVVISVFVQIPIWISIVCFVILFSAFAVCFILTTGAKITIQNIESQTESKTNAIKIILTSVSTLESLCNENEKTELAKLVENIKYSDPVSSKECEDIENEMLTLIDNAKVKGTNVSEVIDKLQLLLKERNIICKKSK